MNSKGQSGLGQIAIVGIVFLFVLIILGQFLAVFAGSLVNTNTGNATLVPGFGNGLLSLVNLIPLILVGAFIVGIVYLAFKLRE